MITENAIRDAFEHNDPAKYQDFFNFACTTLPKRRPPPSWAH